jgi:hypothetical protein
MPDSPLLIYIDTSGSMQSRSQFMHDKQRMHQYRHAMKRCGTPPLANNPALKHPINHHRDVNQHGTAIAITVTHTNTYKMTLQ